MLLPPTLWGDTAAWKENLLLSRFAAPTSAGILFTMLAALHLKRSWIYRKIQVLAIFDDLDTILLMIPLQILMIGLRWQMFVIVGLVAVLLTVGWRWQGRWNARQDWRAILGLALVVCLLTQLVYYVTAHLYGHEESIHIEVLLPAFVVGMLMRHRHIDTPAERRVATGISFLFMLLVGMSMPLMGHAGSGSDATSVTASQPMMPWGTLLLHVVAVSTLSNLGKLVPLLFYRDRPFSAVEPDERAVLERDRHALAGRHLEHVEPVGHLAVHSVADDHAAGIPRSGNQHQRRSHAHGRTGNPAQRPHAGRPTGRLLIVHALEHTGVEQHVRGIEFALTGGVLRKPRFDLLHLLGSSLVIEVSVQSLFFHSIK